MSRVESGEAPFSKALIPAGMKRDPDSSTSWLTFPWFSTHLLFRLCSPEVILTCPESELGWTRFRILLVFPASVICSCHATSSSKVQFSSASNYTTLHRDQAPVLSPGGNNLPLLSVLIALGLVLIQYLCSSRLALNLLIVYTICPLGTKDTFTFSDYPHRPSTAHGTYEHLVNVFLIEWKDK